MGLCNTFFVFTHTREAKDSSAYDLYIYAKGRPSRLFIICSLSIFSNMTALGLHVAKHLSAYKKQFKDFSSRQTNYDGLGLWLGNLIGHIVTWVDKYHKWSKQPAYDTRLAIEENP
jgi:hypothetical protein